MEVVNWISKQAGKIADNFNDYKFFVKADPVGKIDSSSVISLTVYVNRQMNAVVPCMFRWFRKRNGIISEATEYRGNSFICQPSDISSTIQAEVTSSDREHPGVAMLSFGPVTIDVVLKQTIEVALSTGSMVFPIQLVNKESSKQCELYICDEFIKISHCNSVANYRFAYNLGEPFFESFGKDPTKVTIVFNQKYQTEALRFLIDLFGSNQLQGDRKARQLSVGIKFLNRKSKDQFILVMKGFNAKKQMRTSTVINKVEKTDFKGDAFDYAFQIESLKGDLRRLFEINTRQKHEKKMYYEESRRLEEQIEELILSYTKIIEGRFRTKEQFQQSFIDFENKKDKTTVNRYQKVEEENNRLKEYIRTKLDGQFNTNEQYLTTPNEIKGFTKKKEPFYEFQKQPNYEQILVNMSGQEIQLLEDKSFQQINHEKHVLQDKLNHSQLKIQKLQNQISRIQRQNLSNIQGKSVDLDKSHNSALDISTARVIREKMELEKKFNSLKKENQKLKEWGLSKSQSNILEKYIKEQSINHSRQDNPQFIEEAKLKIKELKKLVKTLSRQREEMKLRIDDLELTLKIEEQSKDKQKKKYEKRVFELNQEIVMMRKNNDVMNRSQNLSMEMEDYNSQQNKILREQNQYLLNETERLTKMCQKYKKQYKKSKEDSRILS